MDFFRESESPQDKKFFKEEEGRGEKSLHKVHMNKKTTTLSNFQDVFQRGFQKSRGDIIIRFLKNNDQGLRWGVAVSSKRWKKAVERNTIKRVVREATRPLLLSYWKEKILISFFSIEERGLMEKLIVYEKISMIYLLLLDNKKIL